MNGLESFKGLDISKIATVQPTYNYQNLITPDIQRQLNETYERRKQAEEATIEQSLISKEILGQTQEMNRQLVVINESQKRQLESVNSNLEFILGAIGGNAQQIQRGQIETNKLLIEIQIALQTKDENGLKKFITEHGIEAIGLLLQGLQMCSGLK